jgi:hypothetical protein
VHEESFDNAQEGPKFRRVILPAHHPQRLFYDPAKGPFATLQEKIIATAAAMAEVNHVPGYYENCLWRTRVPPMVQRRTDAILAKRSAQALAIQNIWTRTLTLHQEPFWTNKCDGWPVW